MNETTANFVNETWDNSVIPTLSSYIEIPNMSPNYDPEWATNGKLDEAGQLLFKWAKEREASIKGLSVEWLKLEKRTPLIFATIPATCEENKSTILMYGHFDKQPPLAKWSEGLDPYKPVIRNGKLYGRGGADDGYALLAALTSIEALQKQGIPHARIVVIIEGSEESGSIDLPTYVDHLKERIGTPNLIVCLDSGSGNYDQFWVTTNLRGLVVGNLKVHILEAGAHSGRASGIVPSSFRILRQILDRIEDSKTGELPSELYVEIPTARLNEAKSCANDLGPILHEEFRFVEGSRPVTDNFEELVLNRTWRPTLCVTGVDGLPPLTEAGSVLREYSTVQLSFRIPPTLNPRQTAEFLKEFIEKSPPFGAKVTFDIKKASTGWNAPAMAEWLVEACNANSSFFYKRPAGFLGEGGSIPFMGMLGEKFPEAQFVVTGLLGPESNAHGPDEFLHIQMGKNLTACVVGIIAAHCQNTK